MIEDSQWPRVIGADGAAIPPAPRTNLFARALDAISGWPGNEPHSVILSSQEPGGRFRVFLSHQIVENQPPPGKELAWLPEVYALVNQHDDEAAADIVFDKVDELLSAAEFSRCNELLEMVDVKRLDTNLLISFLAVTLPAKPHLPSRSKLVRRVETRLAELAPDRVEALLKSLR